MAGSPMALSTSHLYFLKAECLCQLKRTAEGLHAVQAAIDLAQQYTDRNWLGELYRIQGLLLSESGENCEIVEAHFRQAMETARQQGARMLELRVAMSLARLWRDQGRRLAAQEVLASVYDQFTEGFDTCDLQAAHSLLQEISDVSLLGQRAD